MTIPIRAAKVDERDRAPKQVDLTVGQKLVARCALDSGDARIDIVIDPADHYRRPQVVGPPMLVPDPAGL